MSRIAAFVLTCLLSLPALAERTALQKHADFFDGNGNNVITVSETYDGLRRLGIDPIRSSAFAVAINLGLGRSTGAAWYEPYNVYLAAIEKGKHASDTDIYDDGGAFDTSRFDVIWKKYDLNGNKEISESELDALYSGQYETAAGSVASRAEFTVLMMVAGEERVISRGWFWDETETVITRETLWSLYDGTLFYVIAGEPVPF